MSSKKIQRYRLRYKDRKTGLIFYAEKDCTLEEALGKYDIVAGSEHSDISLIRLADGKLLLSTVPQ